ncbi:hypothetical protein [Azonexus hydrophilus]|uniref:Uncharacterized protein n=1 Tax=Azonexus hydrophilus TaxID=418702 RepID=A0ABZ2XQL3_9RHOO
MSSLALSATDTLPIGKWAIQLSNAPDAVRDALPRLCLYKKSSWKFSDQWASTVAGTPNVTCLEYLRADLAQRRLYLDIPGFNGRRSQNNGYADAHCPSDSPAAYTACSSAFFTASAEASEYKLIRPGLVTKILTESGLLDALEKAHEAKYAHRKEAEMAIYRARFADITTKAEADSFAEFYKGNDPEGLIPKLQSRINGAGQPGQRHPAVISPVEHPVTPIPLPREDLSLPPQIASVKANGFAAPIPPDQVVLADMAGDTQNKAIQRIRLCRRQIDQLTPRIDQGQSVSRADAELIEMCRQSISEQYGVYLKSGGKLLLHDIY